MPDSGSITNFSQIDTLTSRSAVRTGQDVTLYSPVWKLKGSAER